MLTLVLGWTALLSGFRPAAPFVSASKANPERRVQRENWDHKESWDILEKRSQKEIPRLPTR
ncbi:Hypothetical protein SMAX5B_010239 [Scophthalmus maximus]|uniref:Uncharacterized protein n=1 Tax=Scophthalmus maximus TaxID=52904 RepID=A0A2U9CD49_SCOMX|nr:Hypothetical protein SMAX5B_010239 [Scophthalmus maximus]